MLINEYFRKWKEAERKEDKKQLEKKKKITEADKFTVTVNDLIEESQFENYGEMMLRRYNQAEAERIAKEIDKKIMDLGDVFINIKVKKVDLPDDYIKVMEDGVKIVEELKEYKREIERQAEEIKTVRWKVCLDKRDINELIYQLKETNKELIKANNKIAKLEGDLEYAKCSGWLNRFVYPESDYPVVTYSNIISQIDGTITIDDIFKAVT